MSRITDALNHLANQLWSFAPGSRTPVDLQQIQLVAHRGAHGATPEGQLIENTLAAFDLCLELGIWGIELDVQPTRDGDLLVHHDPHCGRLFNRPDLVLADTPSEQLRQAIPEIPRLAEVIERYAGKLHLMIEIKTSWRQYPDLPQQVEALLKDWQPMQDYHLLSLVPDHLEGFKHTPASAFVDVAEFNSREIIKENLALGHGAVAGSFALLSTAQIHALRQAGRRTGTGMVEKRAVASREIHRGVDWIFSDSVVSLLRD
ncbi:MAG: glycerophosphodiester phosphodiesterase [Nitrincola lacisaponensis]|uniref:glycerophosphodiester phosphodiesterase n=1 Tax=Nitrincola lacisaponensis TaxID=267850 RepID=UPI003919DBAB